MIVRPLEFLAVLTSNEEPNDRRVSRTPQPLHEQLEVSVAERAERGKFVLAVGQRDKAVVLVQRRLMHAAQSPCSRSSHAATDTPTARKLESRFDLTALREGDGTISEPVGRERPEAGHLQADAAAHRASPHIGRFGVFDLIAELGRRATFRDRDATHGSLRAVDNSVDILWISGGRTPHNKKGPPCTVGGSVLAHAGICQPERRTCPEKTEVRLTG